MLAFVRELARDFKRVGAIAPSSPHLARVMTNSLRRDQRAKRLLEVGAGTGAFTRVMLSAMRPGDELHIVEINPHFCEVLDERLLGPFREEHPEIRVTLHCGSIEEAQLLGQFDYIVCGLPFNNFSTPVIRSIFKRLLGLLAEGGELSYFEYLGVRALKGPLVGSRGRSKLKRLGAMNKILRRRHDGRVRLVLGNFPPAVAMRLTRTDGEEEKQPQMTQMHADEKQID